MEFMKCDAPASKAWKWWLHWFASATACQVARPPARIGLGLYFQAFDGSVSLPVAGYHYHTGWISLCCGVWRRLEWQLAALHGPSETQKHVNGGSSFHRKRPQ